MMLYVLDTHVLVWYFATTARFYGADLLTKDGVIRSSGEVGVA